MYLIFGKNIVAKAVASLCEYQHIAYEMRDDSDAPDSYDAYEAIIPSPGVPGTHAIYATGKVIAELDFAYQFLPKNMRITAITGTDGKSTTSWIFYNLLEREFASKKTVFLSGNFEIPFSATVLDILRNGQKKGEIVVEVSSFMAYALGRSHLPPFSPDYTIVTNLQPDHLDWHRDLEEYVDAKLRLVQYTKKMVFVNSSVIDFFQKSGMQKMLPENTRLYEYNKDGNDHLRDRTDGEHIIIAGRKKYLLSETHFSGRHNAENILAATLVTNTMKICSKRTRQYLQDIHELPHRLQKIGEKQGIIIVDDSKSTSSQSLTAALGAFGTTKNLLIIVGGSDKGDEFSHLSKKFASRVKAMVCIGATKEYFIKIAEQENIAYLATDSLEEGVKWLYDQGKKGDVLMLSPGCASFGLFRDYLDRANQFRSAVEKLG